MTRGDSRDSSDRIDSDRRDSRDRRKRQVTGGRGRERGGSESIDRREIVTDSSDRRDRERQ